MKNYYNSYSTSEANKKGGFTTVFALLLEPSKCIFALLMFMMLTLCQNSWAQSTANYAFTTNATSSLALDANANAIDMTTGTTQLVGPGLDANASAVTNIGFPFTFMSNTYTQFSVNEDGQVKLGSAVVGTNSYGLTLGTATAPYLSPINTDFRTGTTTGKIHYKVVGTAPNRTFVLEFKDMQIFYTLTAAAGNSTWQMRIYETSGKIEYVYGTVNATDVSTGNRTPTIGFYTGGTSGLFASVLYATHTVSTTTPYTVNPIITAAGDFTGLSSAANGSRRAYIFTPFTGNPNVPITFTSSTTPTTSTVNWVDDSTNEGYFTIGRSTSPTGPFTIVGTVTSTTAATTGTAYNYVSTGLLPLTAYYYEIKAANESGGVSTGLSGSQTTVSPITYVWNATTGSASWVTPASWTPARNTPDSTDILQFSNGGTSIATAIPTQTVARIEFSNNTTTSLQSAATATLTTNKLTIPTGSTLLSDGNTAALTLAFSAGAINPIDGRLEINNNGFANAITFANSVTTIGTTGNLAAGGILVGAITGTTTTLLINGTYEHKYTTVAGTIPTATWGASSNTNITGYTTNTTAPGGFTQNFNNFTYNCPLQTGNLNFASTGTTGAAGTFTMTNTGTGSLRWTGTGGYTVNANNFVQTGGSFDLASGASGTGIFNVAGTFNKTSGTFQSTGTATSNPTLSFNGTALQSVTFDAQPTGPITYRVANPIGITLNGSFATSFALGNGTLGGLRISTVSATPITFGGTLASFAYNAVNSRLTYDAAGATTARVLEFPTVAGPANLTIATGTGNAVTIPFSRSLACPTVNSILTMTSGDIDMGANILTLGASAAFPGTLSYTAGGIKTSAGGSFVRWYPTTGLPTNAGTGIGYYPLISGVSNRNVALSFSSATALSAGGTIGISHTNAIGLSAVSPAIVDGAYTVDTKSNSSWTATTGNGITATGTVNLRLTSGNAFLTPTVANLRVIQATTALGTHVAGTGTSPNFQANRSTLTLADLANTHYVGAATADITNSYNAVSSGNWNTAGTWSSGVVPGCTDVVTISSGITVTVNSAANNCKNLTIASGGSLVVASGDLTVGCTLFNNFLNNNGTLTVTGGTLSVNGNVANAASCIFNQSGGEVVIDGNNGVTAESVATGTNLLSFLTNNINLSGGKITIVDPHLVSTTATNYSLIVNNATAVTGTLATSPNHTLQLGDGVSTQSGGGATGAFRLNTWETTTLLAYGKIVVKGPTATGREVITSYNSAIAGDVVVENGGVMNLTQNLTFAGNIDVQTGGKITSTAGYTTGAVTANTGSAFTIVPVTTVQSVTNTGTMANAATSTANMVNFTINNSNATGVTLNSPISVSGTLTLTTGIVNTTNTNLLTLGTATAAGTLSGGSATTFVNGPMARTIANGNLNTAYSVFPVGKAGAYAPVSLAPLTTAVSVFKAESFTPNSGTTDTSLTALSALRRWEATAVSGTFTNINVKLGDAAITATSIPAQAPTAAGVYTNAFGPTATYAAGTPNTTASTTPVTTANFTGFLSYAVNNLCLGTPAPGATTATANALCSGQSTTLGVANALTGVGLTYQWQSSSDNVTYTNITGATNATYTVTPTASTYYQLVVTCATGPATGTSTPLQITFANNITGTTPASICGTGTASLAATGSAGTVLNWYATPTSTTSLATGSPFVTPTLTATTTYYVAASSNVIGAGTMGIGTNTTLTGATEQPTAFCNRWPSYLSQTIYTAAELTAQGLSAGNITSMAYNITTLGDAATNANFNVKIGTTAGTNFANTTLFDTTAYTNVYGPSTYTHTATGLQTINFTTPFVWDGTSNIVVYVTMSGADNINNSTTYYTTTTDNKLLWQRSGNVATNALSTSRLNIVFGGQVAVACNSARVPVVATVSTPPAFTLSSNAVSLCNGQSSSPVTVTAGASDYNNITIAPTTGVTGNSVTGYTFNPTVTTTYTVTANQTAGSQCNNSATIIVTVNPVPSAVTVTAPVTTCINSITALTATGGSLSNIDILSENFNAATNNWTTVNNTTGGATPANAAWTLRPDGYTYPLYPTWHSNDNSQFYLTNADAPGNGSTTNTLLQSPAFSTVNFTAVDLKFFNYLYDNIPASTTAKVQASTDGTTWVDLQTIAPTITNPSTPFTQSTVALTAAFLNQPTVYIRFNYSSVWRFFWGIDNVSISGTQSTSVTWSPTTNLYTDALATIPYTGTVASTVYHKAAAVSAAVTYTATATSAATCSVTGTTTVTTLDCGIPYANLQFPGTANMTTCGSTDFYAQVYKAGVTEAAGQGTGITAWIGKNTTNTDPATWPEASWELATFNVQQGNNDEYKKTFTALAAGTYYVASRFVYTPGAYVYGGYTSTGGGIWNGTTNVSAVLTVNAVAAPTATSPQSFTAGATIANIVVTGTTGTVIWYPTSADAIANTNPLATTTTLVNNTTYYVTQTISGCPSTPTSVLVNIVLRNNSFDMTSLQYYPNPVIDELNISYSNTISSIEVYNLLGQIVKTAQPNSISTQLDMSGLPTATYLVKVTSEGKTATIKVVKK